jgi:hypothetical protein
MEVGPSPDQSYTPEVVAAQLTYESLHMVCRTELLLLAVGVEVLVTVAQGVEREDTLLVWPLRPVLFTRLEMEERRLPAAPLATMVTALCTALRVAQAVLELEA